MAAVGLEQGSASLHLDNESALDTSADFSYEEAILPQTEILEPILNMKIPEHKPNLNLVAVLSLHDFLMHQLKDNDDWLARRDVAADFGEAYHRELDIGDADLSEEQKSSLVMSRLYLSNVVALGRLSDFMYIMRTLSRDAPEAQIAKEEYLEARKVLQDDMDEYFEHFDKTSDKRLLEGLIDTANLARLLMHDKEWVNVLTHDYTHQFIGSLLSERVVKVCLQELVTPNARYGTAEEDSSPTKADVVLPLSDGDFYVQVKMKWTKRRTEFNIDPHAQPVHVYIPMYRIRGVLTPVEQKSLAKSVKKLAQDRAAA